MLDDARVTITGQHITAESAALERRMVDQDNFCRRCGAKVQARDSVVRRVTHVPVGWRPTQLHLRLRGIDAMIARWCGNTTPPVS